MSTICRYKENGQNSSNIEFQNATSMCFVWDTKNMIFLNHLFKGYTLD